VPCYAIDIIWHTHQLNPKTYSKDTISLLGNVFPHDDTVNDRTPGSKLCTSDAITRELWAKMFNEKYFMPGKFLKRNTKGKIFLENALLNRSIFSNF
jgi:hypothetical protein